MRTGFELAQRFFKGISGATSCKRAYRLILPSSSNFSSARATNVLLIDPTRNSVSQLASRFAARSAFPNPPHHSNWPFETSATPAPVTWFFSTASFMAFCNSSSVFGCGGSSLF